jgi:hypothetical protein
LVALLGWDIDQLDSALPPRLSYAGARHIILAARTRARLAELDYDYARLKAYMIARDLTTVDLVWRHDQLTLLRPQPFPVGGVVEDPATGSVAEYGCGQLDGRAERAERVPAQPDADAIEKHVAGLRHVSSDHKTARVEQVGHHGHPPAQLQPGVLDHPPRGTVCHPRPMRRSRRTLRSDAERRAAAFMVTTLV